MLRNRGLESKEVGIKGAGLQECHLKAQTQTVVGGAGGRGGGNSNESHRCESNTALSSKMKFPVLSSKRAPHLRL